VDHGIEKPAERTAAGKPESGTLLIRAFHEGGQVVIEIIDDGAGINTDRVRSKALERGLITQTQTAEMTDDEINNLIMLPGFSTAEVVTNLSGRGVGMDVVKTNIEKIGGTVDLNSVRGEGTTLRISIPLTLAIVPALIVRAEGERFAIPQVNLQELVRLDGEEIGNQIEYVSGAETYRLRGDLLPLLRLSEVLRLEKKSGKEQDVSGNGAAGAVEESSSMEETLYEILGGSAAVEAATEEFYRRVMADPELKPFFDSTDISWLKNQQKNFLAQALGGPAEYDGQDMKTAHAHLPIEGRHFTRVAEHLVAALQSLSVPARHIDTVVSLLTPLAQDIVNTPSDGEELPAIGSQPEVEKKKQINILVLVSGNTRYGLIVDRVHDIEEVVVKPLSKHLNSVSAYAGATILGDGKVILILDAFGLAEETNGRFDSTMKENAEKAKAAQAQEKNEMQSLLLFTVASEERFAIPLALISRLEKFQTSDINQAGGKEVIQYRGRILPLLRFEDHLPISRPPESGEEMNIIVFNFEDKEVGLVVTEIVDVVEIAVNLDHSRVQHCQRSHHARPRHIQHRGRRVSHLV
jgi:chemotaxis protein histidine kinase CheA